jgi:hypothetical protein
MTYDPEIFLESLMRELKKYVGTALNNSVRDSSGNPVGLYNPPTNTNGIYELVMEFPTPESMRTKVPLPRTVIHFEIDAIDHRWVGFGDQVKRLNYNSTDQTVSPQEAGWHRINFDVGVWTSDKAGGTTARMRAMQTLRFLFHGKLAQQAFDASAKGDDGRIEILHYMGGRFITETINDVLTYRTVDGTLELRVFSRTPLYLSPPAPAIEEIVQDPNLLIVE